jgi:hypothetical protein
MAYPNSPDPRLNDPLRDRDQRASIDPRDPLLDPGTARPVASNGMVWGWVAGLAIVALVLAFVFGTGGHERTADNTRPIAQPGITNPAATPSAPTMGANRASPPAAPAAPATTTGSGSTAQ